jgi:hypothetical protein
VFASQAFGRRLIRIVVCDIRFTQICGEAFADPELLEFLKQRIEKLKTLFFILRRLVQYYFAPSKAAPGTQAARHIASKTTKRKRKKRIHYFIFYIKSNASLSVSIQKRP